MRKVVQPPLRLGNICLPEEPDRLLPDCLLVEVRLVGPDGLGEGLTDRVDRIEGAPRLLEDHRDIAPPEGLQSGAFEGGDLFPPVPDVAVGNPAVLRQQPHNRMRRHTLAGAAFPDDTEDLPGVYVEADPPDREEGSRRGGKLDGEVVDREEGLGSGRAVSGPVLGGRSAGGLIVATHPAFSRK